MLGALLLSFSFANPSLALDFTAKISRSGQKDHKQYCYSHFEISRSGAWTAKTTFSNGKKLDGDHYYAIMQLLGQDGSVLMSFKHAAGVRSEEFCKGSCERHLSSNGKVDPALVNKLSGQANYVCSGTDQFPDDKLPGIALGVIRLLGR